MESGRPEGRPMCHLAPPSTRHDGITNGFGTPTRAHLRLRVTATRRAPAAACVSGEVRGKPSEAASVLSVRSRWACEARGCACVGISHHPRGKLRACDLGSP